jgi:hypothetical protein
MLKGSELLEPQVSPTRSPLILQFLVQVGSSENEDNIGRKWMRLKEEIL